MDALTRKVEFFPAFDKRDSDPNKNYGIHCVDVMLSVSGEKGAVSYQVYSGWYPSNVEKEWRTNGAIPLRPMSAGCDYHSRTPMWEGQTPIKGCVLLNGDDCYCDGTLITDDLWELMLTKGGDAVFEELESRYRNHFENEEVSNG